MPGSVKQAPAAGEAARAGSETGDIFDIQRFSVNDGPGIRTIVFLKSCPLECQWCSNPESRHSSPELLYTLSRCLASGECVSVCPQSALTITGTGIVIDRTRCDGCGDCVAVCPSGALRLAGRRVTIEQVLDEVLRDRIFYEHSGGGMTLSGGEPLAQPGFARALLRRARALGIHTAVETSGSAGADAVRRVLSETDLILYDIKQIDPQKHRAGTGKSNRSILRNARIAAGVGVPMVIRVPVIPGFNDTPGEIMAIGEFAKELRVSELHLLPYHRYGVSKYAALGRPYPLADAVSPTEMAVRALRAALEALGLNVKIGG